MTVVLSVAGLFLFVTAAAKPNRSNWKAVAGLGAVVCFITAAVVA